MNKTVVKNPWRHLSEFTDARIGLGRTGVSLPTHELLRFQLAHAQAQDAVYAQLELDTLVGQLTPFSEAVPTIVHSRAKDRAQYLCRPDYGRRLDETSVHVLKQLAESVDSRIEITFDLAIVIADGLSARAINANTVALLRELLPRLTQTKPQWHLAPPVIVQQGRVAVGDEVGELLNAKCVLLLIGERPGLSSPDSLGAYITWNPVPGKTDAARNCVSNVRPAGLVYSLAAEKIAYLLQQARSRQISGVNLKDRSVNKESLLTTQVIKRNFLLQN